MTTGNSNAGNPDAAMSKQAAAGAVKDFAWGETMARSLWSFYQGFDPVLDGKTVLDFGCSWGYLVKHLHENFRPRRLIGVDIEPHWRKLSGHWDWQALNGEVEFHSGQLATGIDVPDASVDLVLCTSVLQYIRPEMLELTFARLYRLLRPGGEILLRTRAFGSHIGADLHRDVDIPFVHMLQPVWHLWRLLEKESGERPRYLNCLTPSSYLAIFARAGFEVVTARRRGAGKRAPEIQAQIQKAFPWIAPTELLSAELECRLRRPGKAGETTAASAPRATPLQAPQAARGARPATQRGSGAAGEAIHSQASIVFEAAFPPVAGRGARLTVEALRLPRDCVFLEHSLPRDGSGPGKVIVAEARRPVLYESADLGETWRAIPLQSCTQRPLRRHFLTAEGWRILQTDLPAETLVVDAAGELVAKPALGDLNWHGTWAIDQAASGVLMFGQYRGAREPLGGELHVFRSADGGRSWSSALAVPGRREGVDGEIRHFHVCQADPHVRGRWYVTSGDRTNECAFWITDDDGLAWRRLYPVMADGRDIRADSLPRLLRLTAFAIEPDALVWITDDNINGGHAALCRLEKSGWKLHELAACGENLMRSFVRMDDGRYVAISEVKDDLRGASVCLVDGACQPAGAVVLPNASGRETGFTYATASRAAWRGAFFTKTDQRMLGTAAGALLRWRLAEVARETQAPAREPAAPHPAGTGAGTAGWFPADFEPREDDLLVFFHSQRTGGMSLRRLIQRAYGDGAVMAFRKSPYYAHWGKLDAAALKGYKAYAGHAPFAEKSLGRRCLYISLVRNPRDRLVSLYRYIRGRAGHKFHPLATSLDIGAFYRQVRELDEKYVSNRQTRFVCGRPDAGYAIDLIATRYFGVGVLDHVDQFAGALARALRWPVADVGSENAASTPLDFELPDSFITLDREINAEDWKLYEHLRQRWSGRA